MQDLRITFLGTSSASPSKQRNVSSVAMTFDGRTFLFDCGEATQHQLLHAPVRSGSIEAIFVSHLHGDHVYGLPGLLATFSLNGRTEPLVLVGPSSLREYVQAMLVTSFHNPQFALDIRSATGGSDPRLVYESAGARVLAATLDHTIESIGYCLVEEDRPGAFDVERARALGVPEGPLFGELQRGGDVLAGGRVVRSAEVVGPPRKGRRVAYCTDTRPCAGSVALATEADILIHEATYDQSMAADADARGHSTAAGAAEVARTADVARLVLTHFSARHEDVTPLLTEARAVFPQTDAAADFLEITVR